LRCARARRTATYKTNALASHMQEREREREREIEL